MARLAPAALGAPAMSALPVLTLPEPLPLASSMNTPKAAIDRVYGAACSDGKRSAELQRILYRPSDDSHLCWLLRPLGKPISHPPAFHRVKIAIQAKHPSAEFCLHDRAHQLIGIYFEKGLEGPAAEYALSLRHTRYPRYAMRPSLTGLPWDWENFFSTLATGGLDPMLLALTHAPMAGGMSPVVCVSAGIVDFMAKNGGAVSDFDVPKADCHEVQYRIRDGRLAIAHDHPLSNTLAGRLLGTRQQVAAVTSLSELSARIRAITAIRPGSMEPAGAVEWAWVDVFIGFAFFPAPETAPGVWDAKAVWDNIGKIVAPWVW
jgi:hypothetical protein